MKLTEILKRNRELSSRLTGDQYKIALISNIIVTQFKEILELTLREEGVNAEVTVGDYDAIVQDSVRFAKYNAVLVFWEAGNFIEGLQNKAYSMSSADMDALAERVEGEIGLMLHHLKSTPLVLINCFSAQIFCEDALRHGPLPNICKRLNVTLSSKVKPNHVIVALDNVLSKLGRDAAVDFRQFQSSKALYSIGFFKAYAEAVKPAFMAATGRPKKVLVLDCDNTLWGGILGEDGFIGIEMSDSTIKGQAFREVQTILQGLRKDGVLLALCSKNNPSDVDQVLNEHQDMILRNDDLVAKKVNWRDKVTNLRELATELNLGLESFVFVDDSAFEVGLIKKELPQVMCLQVPQNLSEYSLVFRKLSRMFFSLSRTAEDDRKTVMYQQEHLRKEQLVRFDSIDDYLASLELKIKVLWDAQIQVSRAAQMTQKTNQFNLTSKRYTEADVQRMLADQDYILSIFSVEDRYGDYGVTGMIIIRKNIDSPGSAVIDNFLMSCRVIGRNVEYAFIDKIFCTLEDRSIYNLQAEYMATAKNSQVERFYDNLGFELISDTNERRVYQINLVNYKPQEIQYIKVSC